MHSTIACCYGSAGHKAEQTDSFRLQKRWQRPGRALPFLLLSHHQVFKEEKLSEYVKQRAWLSTAEAGAPAVRTLLWDFFLARDHFPPFPLNPRVVPA